MLEFVKYEFEAPKFDVDECRQRDLTYAAPLKVTLAPDRVRSGRGHRRQVDQGHQGAGRLHGRHAAHDVERHLHHQRHRARHRLPDAPLAGRLLRPRQGQVALVGQASVRRPRDPLSRLLARHRVRLQGHRACAHRPPPQDPGDVAPDGAGHGRRGDPVDLLQPDHLQACRRPLAHPLQRGSLPRPQGGHRPGRRRHRRGRRRGGQEDHGPPGQAARRQGPEGDQGDRRRPLRQLSRRGHRQLRDRRDLSRGRRRDRREDAEGAATRPATTEIDDPRHRPRQRRRLHPQHAGRRQEREPPGRAVRHLPRDAPGRAADAGDGRGDVQVAVLRSASATTFRRSAASR